MWREIRVREVRAGEPAALAEVERTADGVFGALGIVFPPGPAVIEQVWGVARVLVAGEPVVGFAAVSEVDGQGFLEQIAVRAEWTGRGVGGVLLERVIEDAPGELALITFRDVPWNAPWYARFGFAELAEERWGPGLRAHWRAEIDAGLHALGPRVIMHRPKGR